MVKGRVKLWDLRLYFVFCACIRMSSSLLMIIFYVRLLAKYLLILIKAGGESWNSFSTRMRTENCRCRIVNKSEHQRKTRKVIHTTNKFTPRKSSDSTKTLSVCPRYSRQTTNNSRRGRPETTRDFCRNCKIEESCREPEKKSDETTKEKQNTIETKTFDLSEMKTIFIQQNSRKQGTSKMPPNSEERNVETLWMHTHTKHDVNFYCELLLFFGESAVISFWNFTFLAVLGKKIIHFRARNFASICFV